jgi:hypothetical protein
MTQQRRLLLDYLKDHRDQSVSARQIAGSVRAAVLDSDLAFRLSETCPRSEKRCRSEKMSIQ